MIRGIGYEVRRIHYALRRALEPVLASQCGLSPSQYGILRMIDTVPGASGAELARRVSMTPQALHEAIERLEADGFVVRRVAPASRRSMEIYLTARALDATRRANRIVERVERTIFQNLSEADIAQFMAWLRRCADRAEAARPAAVP